MRSGECCVKTMVARFFATALAKQRDHAAAYIENGALHVWTHGKTIRKASESRRIAAARKSLPLKFAKAPR